MDRRPTIAVVPLLLVLLRAVACDPESVHRPRRFVVIVPSLVGRDCATVIGYDGLCRPRFEEDDDGDAVPTKRDDRLRGCDGRPDGGCDRCCLLHRYLEADPPYHQPAPSPANIIDQYDALLQAAILNINEKYEALKRTLAFNHRALRRFQLDETHSS